MPAAVLQGCEKRGEDGKNMGEKKEALVSVLGRVYRLGIWGSANKKVGIEIVTIARRRVR